MAKKKKRDLAKDLAEYEKSRLQSGLNNLNKSLNSAEEKISEVEESLYKKAVGCTVTETTKKISNGRVHTETKIKQVQPDQRSIEYFLNNRAAKKWSSTPKSDDDEALTKLDEILKGVKENAADGKAE